VSNAVIRVTAARDTWDSKLNSASSTIGACQTLGCFDTSSLAAADTFATFGRALRAIPFPSAAAAAAGRLAADTTSSERGWKSMAGAVSFTDYEDKADATENAGTQFDSDYSALSAALSAQSVVVDQQAATLNAQAATLDKAGRGVAPPGRGTERADHHRSRWQRRRRPVSGFRADRRGLVELGGDLRDAGADPGVRVVGGVPRLPPQHLGDRGQGHRGL